MNNKKLVALERKSWRQEITLLEGDFQKHIGIYCGSQEQVDPIFEEVSRVYSHVKKGYEYHSIELAAFNTQLDSPVSPDNPQIIVLLCQNDIERLRGDFLSRFYGSDWRWDR